MGKKHSFATNGIFVEHPRAFELPVWSRRWYLKICCHQWHPPLLAIPCYSRWPLSFVATTVSNHFQASIKYIQSSHGLLHCYDPLQLTTELACIILSTMRNRNKMVNWTAVGYQEWLDPAQARWLNSFHWSHYSTLKYGHLLTLKWSQ